MITVIDTDIVDQSQDTAQASVSIPVDVLVSIRERITCQYRFDHQVSIIDDIDAALQQVPTGARIDVDRLLGR